MLSPRMFCLRIRSKRRCSSILCLRRLFYFTAERVKSMSITVHIYYTGDNGSARRFAQEMTESGIVRAVREEAGNEQYAYFFPMEDSETVLLIDCWKDQRALDLHHQSALMEKIADLRKKYHLRMKVERYIPE